MMTHIFNDWFAFGRGKKMVGSARKIIAKAASIAALIICVTMPTAGVAASVTSFDPATIVTTLQDAGYKAKLSKNKDGDPVIESASQGNTVQISLLNCKDNKNCDQLEMIILWSCAPEDLKRCQVLDNKWNGEENFSSTVILGDHIFLYKHILFDKAGISRELFIRNIEMFAGDAVRLMAEF